VFRREVYVEIQEGDDDDGDQDDVDAALNGLRDTG
jgi:sRNA-binding carbon storage regulator CsrA